MPGALSPWPVVAIGLNGHPVKTLQYLLRARGHNVTVDGDFGPQTDTAVKADTKVKADAKPTTMEKKDTSSKADAKGQVSSNAHHHGKVAKKA